MIPAIGPGRAGRNRENVISEKPMTQFATEAIREKRVVSIRGEVERILGCIAEGADHYAVLKISRRASIEEIRKAYCRSVDLLHPLKCRDVIEREGTMQWKLSQAFLRVVEAFSTLSRPARRIEYDGALNRRPTAPLPLPPVADGAAQAEAGEIRVPRAIELVAKRPRVANAFGIAAPTMPRVGDRRRTARFSLRMPVRVTPDDGSWQEVTESWDVSKLGIKFRLKQKLEPGAIVHLEMPMPPGLRSEGESDGLYVTSGIVRHTTLNAERGNLVGVEFVHPSALGSDEKNQGMPEQLELVTTP